MSKRKENLGAIKKNNETVRSLRTRKSTSCSDKTMQVNNEATYQKSTNNRKALGDLDSNIKVNKIIRQPIAEEKEVQTILPINISKNNQAPKVRSKSQSTVVNDNKISIAERKNITVRRRLSSTSNLNVELNKPHVDSCVTLAAQKVPLPLKRKASELSPIKPNVYTSRSSLLSQGIPDETKRPAKKATLIHKSLNRHDQHLNLDLYNAEYFEDIIRHQLNNNWKYVAEKNFLKYQNVDENNRATIVNWLIQVVDYLEQPISVLFMSIRLFDDILKSTCVPKNMYQLSGLVVLWIISKLDDNINAILMSKMLLLSNHAYTKEQFLELERKLLKFFNYELIMPDVTIFASFYLKNLKLQKEERILTCVHYILECYSLRPEFSTVVYSKQAAAAVCLTVNILFPNKNNLWCNLKNLIAYHSTQELEDIMQNMLEQINIIQDPMHMHRQPYLKYSKPDKFRASIFLLRKLVAT